MAVQPFAGGEWAHDATMVGRSAGWAANGQSQKALQEKATDAENEHVSSK